MVAGEPTPAGDPGDAALHDPSFGKDGKALGRGLGLWIGDDQALIASCPQTPHRLHIPPKMLFGPLKKLAPVMPISPNEGKPGKASSHKREQLLACRQVRITGCCHLDFHQIALGIHEQVPFATPDSFAHVKAFLWSTNRARLDGLAVNHSGTGLFITPLLFSLLAA